MADKFLKRSSIIEQMDDLQVHGSLVDRTLKELDIINRWLGGNSVTLEGLERLRLKRNREYHVADLGCGSGRMLRLMCDWGRKKGFRLKFTGVDANEYIIQYARKNLSGYPEISLMTSNILEDRFRQKRFDIITSTLFAHHFNQEQLSDLIKIWQKQATRGIIINDLHRHWIAYHSIKLITSTFSKSQMVKNDAPISVLRGFVRNDWQQLMKSCDIDHYQLSWHWAFRWLLVIPSNI